MQYSQPGSQYKWLSTLHSTSDHLLATYFHCSCGEIFRLLFDCWFFLFLLALLIFRTKKENELKPAIAAGLLWFVLRSSYSLACLPLSALPLRGWTGIIIIILILSFSVANPIVITTNITMLTNITSSTTVICHEFIFLITSHTRHHFHLQNLIFSHAEFFEAKPSLKKAVSSRYNVHGWKKATNIFETAYWINIIKNTCFWFNFSELLTSRTLNTITPILLWNLVRSSTGLEEVLTILHKSKTHSVFAVTVP